MPRLRLPRPRSRSAMVQMLELLRERHTDPLAPLREAGLTESLIAVLRAKALSV